MHAVLTDVAKENPALANAASEFFDNWGDYEQYIGAQVLEADPPSSEPASIAGMLAVYCVKERDAVEQSLLLLEPARSQEAINQFQSLYEKVVAPLCGSVELAERSGEVDSFVDMMLKEGLPVLSRMGQSLIGGYVLYRTETEPPRFYAALAVNRTFNTDLLVRFRQFITHDKYEELVDMARGEVDDVEGFDKSIAELKKYKTLQPGSRRLGARLLAYLMPPAGRLQEFLTAASGFKPSRTS